MHVRKTELSPVVVVSGKSHDSTVALSSCIDALAGTAPAFILAFVGGRHRPDFALQRIHEAFGQVPVAGGAAAGVVTRDMAQYTGSEICLAAFLDPLVAPTVVSTDRLLECEHRAGIDLGRMMGAEASDGGTVMVFYDSVRREAPLQLHPASRLVDGMLEGLQGKKVEMVGGGTLTDLSFAGSYVFDGDKVARHTAVALVFPPQVKSTTVVCHGCVPASAFMQITRIDGAEVYELDGQPALDVVEDMVGFNVAGKKPGELSLIATLGHKQGDIWGPNEEDAYVNRLILKGNRETKSVTIFEPDFELGTTVQVMSRDNHHMVESVRNGALRINERVGAGRPLLNMWINCAGRARIKSGGNVEESDVLRKTVTNAVPLAGFYSGVEIAPFDGNPRPLDWTGVLTHLYVDA